MEFFLKAVLGIIFDFFSAILLMVALNNWHGAAAGIPALGFWSCFIMVIAIDVIITGSLISHNMWD